MVNLKTEAGPLKAFLACYVRLCFQGIFTKAWMSKILRHWSEDLGPTLLFPSDLAGVWFLGRQKKTRTQSKQLQIVFQSVSGWKALWYQVGFKDLEFTLWKTDLESFRIWGPSQGSPKNLSWFFDVAPEDSQWFLKEGGEQLSRGGQSWFGTQAILGRPAEHSGTHASPYAPITLTWQPVSICVVMPLWTVKQLLHRIYI